MSLPLQNLHRSVFDNVYSFTASPCQTQDKVTPFAAAAQQ
ncbi:hypothetical protein SAMCFNEI73_Ch0720 [Sinorhizobium americanum]|uniref:Uncharacterized protein n=1 Tax=Sinorhizobium americanum TaxID=194963 RepID=A0A1L3LJ19_9HYPH|nr:hypothetical protein SAMCCGM7_Ch0724 [Sinorhizobium americanum CCGM7]APG90045.1 hypothetical protein SAMCFNEI73_Ch0720 [Sinorhizobium americanum]